MSDNVDFLSLIHEGEILAACRALYPTTHSVLNIQAARTTPPVPGFTSLMLRVCVTAKLTDGSENSIKLIYKRPPIAPKIFELIENLDTFSREVAYFRDAVPLLQRRCPHLSLVKCYYSQDATVILEDLNDAGFSSVIPDIRSMGGEHMTLGHARLVVRCLANLHAASLGTDWPAVLPHLAIDAHYDSKFAQVLRTYVEAFKAAVCSTPDLLTLETLLADFDTCRFFGLGTAVIIQPLMYYKAEQVLPKAGEPMTAEHLQAMMNEPSAPEIETLLHENSQFRVAMLELAEEVIGVLDKTHLV